MKNKNQGFTLMELVIVISIIGILAAIITPKMRLSIIRAKDLKIESDLVALRTASNLYYNERNKMLGGSDLGTGSGVEQGMEVDYVPYNEKNKARGVTAGHIKELINTKYLDKNASNSFLKNSSSDTDIIKILPGTNMEKSGNCSTVGEPLNTANYLAKELYLIFDSDKVGISIWDGETSGGVNIDDGRVDSRCIPWNAK